MSILFFDTSTEWILIGYYEKRGDSFYKSKYYQAFHPKESVTHLVPLLSKTVPVELPYDQIVVGTGPGSFAGIRTSVAVAKNLSQLLHVPVYGVSLLELLYYQKEISTSKHHFTFIDGKMKKYYVTQWNNGNIQFFDLDINQLREIHERGLIPIGDTPIFENQLQWENFSFDFSNYFNQKDFNTKGDYEDLEPNYLRSSYIQEK